MPPNPFSPVTGLGAPAGPGLGQYSLSLETWAFAILVGVLGLLLLMHIMRKVRHPTGRGGSRVP